MRWGQVVGAVESVADAIEYMLSDGRQGCGADRQNGVCLSTNRATPAECLPQLARGARARMAHGSAARASSPSLCALLLLGAIRQAATLQLQLASNGHARAATTTEAATRAGALRLIVTESCAVCHTQGSNPGRADLGLGHIPHAAAHQCTQTGLLLTRARLVLDSGASPSVSRPRRASTRTRSSNAFQSGTPY